MIKYSLIFLLGMITFFSHADQQSVLYEEDAQRTVEYLQTQQEIVLYCGCCSNDTYDKITLNEVSYECEASNWCRVRIQGVDQVSGDSVNRTIDLAYAWVNVEGVAQNLAWEVGLNSNPCSPSFDWETYKPIRKSYFISKDKKEIEEFEHTFAEFKEKLESQRNFEVETFDSGKTFVVNEVSVKKDLGRRAIVISHKGDSIEQQYIFPLHKIESIELDESGILVSTKEDGVVTVEEFDQSKLKYRMFWFEYTIPVLDVTEKEVEWLRSLSQNHHAMTK
ncbi:MAG: hypothetical protein HWE22_11630 [Flavobacteriales bacterium]|nr:hypothetical protein [Flavobacteriales bacterium]